MRRLIKHGTIVNEGRSFKGDLVMEDDIIENVYEDGAPLGHYDEVTDATGCLVVPGVIDDHVHFREPGLTHKADIESESRAAAYGGVTSYLEMPNTVPQTTTPKAWEEKRRLAAEKSHVNYAFFYGATNENVETFSRIDRRHLPGIKLFMGSSTGNMLVDDREALEKVFAKAKELELPVMTHCEDTQVIDREMLLAKYVWGDDPDVTHHPQIRTSVACLLSSVLAVEMARKYGTRLHIAHVSTAQELVLLGMLPNITGEAVIAHLAFNDTAYARKGTLAKCNPAIKTEADRQALWNALGDGRIFTIGTDHAPHELEAKKGGCAKAASGMPMVQFSLVYMLTQALAGKISFEQVVQLMCHNPAILFGIEKRGFLRPGYKADVVVLARKEWTLTRAGVQSKCGWSPMEGESFGYEVAKTFCNGSLVYDDGIFDMDSHGEELTFGR